MGGRGEGGRGRGRGRAGECSTVSKAVNGVDYEHRSTSYLALPVNTIFISIVVYCVTSLPWMPKPLLFFLHSAQ